MSAEPKNRSLLLLPDPPGEVSAEPGNPMASPSRPLLSDLLRPVHLDPCRLRENRIVTLDRDHPASAAFDVLRTKLLRLARKNGWTTIGITAPTAQSGTTSVALNLAFSLSHQADHRTLLLDLNLRNPRLAALLGEDGAMAFGDLLAGGGEVETALVRHGETLAIGASAAPVAGAAEVLQASATLTRIAEIRRALEPDLVLVDAPPVLQRDDFQATLGLYDAVLLVADTRRTLVADLDRCERQLSEQTNVIGVVINRCRFER